MRRHSRAIVIVAALSVFAAVGGAVGSAGAATAFFQKDFAEMGQVPNTSDGICSAAADINSFIYLWNHFPQVYGGTNLLPDWDGDGTLTQSDYIASREKLAKGWEHNGTSRLGIHGSSGGAIAKNIWEQTLYWFEDFAPGTTVFDGQISQSFASWHGGDALSWSLPRWSFLWDSLVAAMDVELGLLPIVSGDAHAVTFTGMAFDDLDGDGRWDSNETVEQIGYLDPNKLSQITWADVSAGPGGRIEFTWWQNGQPYYVYRAFSEGPIDVPEPASAVSLVVLLVFGALGIRRRKR